MQDSVLGQAANKDTHEKEGRLMGKKKKKAAKRKPRTARLAATEVEAYDFIRQKLTDLDWVVKNPSAGRGGQVWTQNQCLSHPDIKAALVLERPENIVQITESTLWVIEAKARPHQIEQAVDEAIAYSDKINDRAPRLSALVATGVAGNEDAPGYIIRTKVKLEDGWQTVTINDQEATGLLSRRDIRTLLSSGGCDIHEFAPSQWLFLQSAERINEILHEGGINKNDRAKTISALLLCVADEPPPNLDTGLRVLIAEINGRSEAVLQSNGKPEFAPFVKILPPTNTTNHVKFKQALVRTIQELQDLNIRSAMNSSTDVLGQFYEVFLKYGNGAKEIGIVLTPRHITRFAVEALGVSVNDFVLDPACGTGGFLVAAFDHVRRTCTPQQLERFKEHHLYGIEQEPYIAILAIVNMIFRGDGKHNIAEGNCFTTHIAKRSSNGHIKGRFLKRASAANEEVITAILMNPPFALKGSLEQEHKFVTRALEFLEDGGVLFSLLPLDALFGAREERTWREHELLRNHTLVAVISFPHELFYPAAQKQVAGIIVKKGIPHDKQQPVFWARVARDGHLKVKSRRLYAAELRPPREELDQIPDILPHLQNFVANPGTVDVNIPMVCKTSPIDFEDPLLELLPEAYLDNETPSPQELRNAVDDMVRETVAFLIRFNREDKATHFHEAD